MYLLGSGLNPFRGFFLFIGNWCFADANIGYHRCMAIKRPPNVIQRLCRFFGPVEPVAGVRTRKRIATLKDVGRLAFHVCVATIGSAEQIHEEYRVGIRARVSSIPCARMSLTSP